MLLTEQNLTQLAETAIAAATEAGKMIAQSRPQNVQRKEGGQSLASQVLTEVDGQSQDIILQILEPTLDRYDLALLTEESEDDHSRLEKDYFWCIDPIDGTLPFIEDTPGYAVSIALVSRDGTPQIGVVYDPVGQTLYHAIRGQGAFRDQRSRLQVSVDSAPLSLITDRSFKNHPQFNEIISGLETIADELGFQGLETQMIGGACMNACWVLESPPACYFKFPKPTDGGGCLWDYAATACIFHEAGAVATDMFGNPLDLNRADSTFMNHYGILFATDPGLARCIVGLYSEL